MHELNNSADGSVCLPVCLECTFGISNVAIKSRWSAFTTVVMFA